MNGKIKSVVMVALILGFVASAIYVVPTLAYMNGDVDQTRDRDQIRGKDCTCDCTCTGDQYQDQNQTQKRAHLRLQECTPMNCEASNWQHQYQHECRHQSMLSP